MTTHQKIWQRKNIYTRKINGENTRKKKTGYTIKDFVCEKMNKNIFH